MPTTFPTGTGSTPADLLVQPFQGVVEPEFLPVGDRESGESQDVGSGVRQHLGRLGEMFLQLSDHPVGLGVDLLW